MSKKQDSPRRADTQSSPNSAHALLERLFLKQQLKEAVKQAKLNYKGSATPENHRLLERAYFLRALQLSRSGLHGSAVEVSRHLLKFGVTDLSLLEDFARLLLTIGLSQEANGIQGRLESPEAANRLAILAADQAVLHPERSKPPTPEIAHDAALVRDALVALEANDEKKALEFVRGVARLSPLSDWKLFVRGLAAYYRRNHDETSANWDRLDTQRPPWRLAERLKSLEHAQSAGVAGDSSLGALEWIVFGQPVLPKIHELRTLLVQKRWTEIVRRIPSLRITLSNVEPSFSEQLTRALIEPLMEQLAELDYRKGDLLVTEFIRAAEPLPIDPHWNRLWGLVWEGPGGDPSEAIPYWMRYVDELETLPGFTSDERPLARAMVWRHLAQLHLDEYELLTDEDAEFGFPGFDDQDREEAEADAKIARVKALECLENSLQIAPRHRPTYDLLVEAYESWQEPEKVEHAKERILELFPDDLEILHDVVLARVRRDEPAPALEYIKRAREQKPLEEALPHLESMVRLSLARCLALGKKWDAGRAEFAALEGSIPSIAHEYHYLARRAILETKAGQRDLADRYEKEAMSLLVEPTPLWLVFSIESIRYNLTKATQKHYLGLWQQELKKKCRSETAGEMSRTMLAFLGLGIEYPGRERQIKELVGYLRRTTRMNYRREDLEQVCQFLEESQKERPLLEKLIQRGLKKHGDSVVFNMLAAKIELAKFPFAGRLHIARHHLEQAISLAEASTSSDDNSLVSKLRNMLSVCNELAARCAQSPFGGFGELPFGNNAKHSFSDFIDLIGDDDGEDDGEEDIFGPFFGTAHPRAPQPRGKPKSASKSKRKK
jgi:tetratricopeptide (TPR) repeat protein